MICDNMQEQELDLGILQGAKFLQAYIECSDEIQEGVRELVKMVSDPETDPDDRLMCLHTLADALLPHPHAGLLGLDLEESEAMGAQHSEETRQCIEEMDREEQLFAERLSALIKERGLTQAKLAEMVNVTQPAISNMLNRQCRPQRATIVKLAAALEVEPISLWPAMQS